MSDEHRRDRWEGVTEWPLTFAAVCFLVAYALPILRPDLSSAAGTACEFVTWVVWVAFAVDYVARLTLSHDRGAFVRGNVVDLAVLILPMLRPLRLLRLVMVLNVLNRGASRGLRGRVAVFVVGATILVVLVGGLAMLDAERGQPEANIETPGDAWWWAITTITTVGYGDRYPVTLTGRLVAVALMICGIALIGVVTASLASWLIERISAEQVETRSELADLLQEVRELRAEVSRGRLDGLQAGERTFDRTNHGVAHADDA